MAFFHEAGQRENRRFFALYVSLVGEVKVTIPCIKTNTILTAKRGVFCVFVGYNSDGRQQCVVYAQLTSKLNFIVMYLRKFYITTSIFLNINFARK